MKPAAQNREGRSAAAAVSAAGVLWGVSAVVVRGAFNQRVDPFTLVQGRLLLGSALLGLALAIYDWRLLRIDRLRLPGLLVWALFGLFSVQASYFWAVSLAGVATAVFLQYTSPVLTALWARSVAREHLGSALLLAIGLSLGGAAALVFGGGEQVHLTGLALLAGGISSVGSAFGAIYGKRALTGLASPASLLYGMLVSLAASLFIRSPLETVHALWPDHAGQWLFVAVGATVLPYALYLYGLSRLPPTSTILLAMIEPVVGVLGAWIFLGESLTALQIAGAGLVMAGVWLVQRRTAPAPDAGSALSGEPG